MIRHLTRADDDALRDLFARAADYIQLESGAPPNEATLTDFWSAAPPNQRPEAGVRLGWFMGERLLGKAEMAFGWPEPTDAYVGLMLLDPAVRGQGIGPRLLAALTGIARARGATRQLVAVLEANPRGRAFWDRQGFSHLLSVPGDDGHIRHRLARPI